MTPLFTINFRREIYLRERARSRARLLALGGWLFYFGLLGVVVGLYGLNCGSLTRRARQLERQTARLEAAGQRPTEWVVDPALAAVVERYHRSPGLWRDKLAHLGAALPANVALTSIAVNPENLSGSSEQITLVIAGQLRSIAGQDPMRGVVQLVSALQRDQVFAAGYQTIKLSQSRLVGGAIPAMTEFVIECR